MKRGLLLILMLILLVSFVSADEIDDAIEKVKEVREEMISDCIEDPYDCSCESIPCEDLLDAEHEKKEKAYARCVEERDKCKLRRKEGIFEMEKQRADMTARCKRNLDDCSCSGIKSKSGREECELAVIEAKYQAKKQRDDMITNCMKDISSCDCSSIENEDGRKECENELAKAKNRKAKMVAACRENPVACDCSSVESESGRKECRDKKNEALSEASSGIKAALSKCFKDVNKCDCSALGLPEESYVAFCEEQKAYGFDCRDRSVNCDKLDEIEIYPPGMPPWLGTIFAKHYSSFIEKEKEKAAKEAASMIKVCILDTENCDCSAVPSYAQAFCENKKELQLKCYDGNYDACVILEESETLPSNMPKFTLSFVDKLAENWRKSRADASKAKAAKEVGDMILECMDGSANCDCSIAPKGKIKTFCEHKKELVRRCVDEGKYDACFTLDEEPLMSSDVPDFIRDPVEKSIGPKVEEKKQKIFDDMKKGTLCEDAKTIKECKEVIS